MWHRLSLRAKLVSAGVLVLCAAIFLLTWNAVQLIDGYVLSQFQARVRQDQPMFNAALAGPMAQRDYATVQAILREARQAQGFAYLIVCDNAQRLLAYEGWQPGEPLPDASKAQPAIAPDGVKRYDFDLPLQIEGQPLGRLKFGLTATALEAARRQLIQRALIGGGTGLVLFSLLLAAAAYLLTKPLARLAAASRQIHAGDYDVNLPRGGQDEIGALTEDFRHMAAEVKRRVAELTQSEAALRAANQAKSNFLANMSHEIRTPINGVVGMTDLLSRSRLSGEQMEYVDAIRLCGAGLLTVINDILDYSKIEAGSMLLENRPFDLGQCLEDALTIVAVAAEKKNLNITYSIDDDVPAAIHGDPLRLRQVLINLLSNAIKFTDQGEVTLTAAWHPETSDGPALEIAVRDTGVGIDPAKQRELFQPFYQADDSSARRYGGTGLGLVICRRLVELMGGTIGVESTPGQGSIFHFTLAATPAALSMAQSDCTALHNKRLLIASDHAASAAIISALGRRWGMECVVTGKAHQVGPLLATTNFDVILIDPQQVQSETLLLVRDLRRRPGQSRTSVVALAYPNADLSGDNLPFFDGHARKPIRQKQLLSTLVAAVTGGKSENAHAMSDDLVDPSLRARYADLRLLVAEDNPINLRLMSLMLEKLSIEADSAANGREAVAATEQQRYDVILMDVQMPELDGLAATKAIRSASYNSTPYIVAVSANVLPDDRQTYLDAGMNAFLSKPFTLAQLTDALNQAYAYLHNGALTQTANMTIKAPGSLIDPARFEEIAGLLRQSGKAGTLRALIEELQADVENFDQQLMALEDHGDTVALARAANALKGAGIGLGAQALGQCYSELHELAQAGNATELAARLLSHRPLIDASLHALKRAVRDETIARGEPAADL